MNLGFDATTIRGNKTGVGYYSANLLERLTRVGGDQNPIDEVLLLSNQPFESSVPRARALRAGHFPSRAIWMQARLPFILERARPDLCHFTNFLAPLHCTVPYVVTVHDMTLDLLPHCHTWRKRLLTARLVPEIARRARLVITPSRSARADLARVHAIAEDKIRVVPHAPDARFRPDHSESTWARVGDRYGLRRPYLLYVGTLEPRKNLISAVAAFARLADRFPEHHLYLAGDLGWQSSDLFRKIDELRLGERVGCLGYVDEADLPGLYSHAELFLYPSLYEGFGLPVVEAMACGVPVLTSSTSSLAEIAEDAALLVDPHDGDAMTQALEHILTDSHERERLVAAGLDKVSGYSWERTARETLAVYEEALGRTDTSPIRRRAASDDELARAIVKTVEYAALFDYPMTLPEIFRGLVAVAASSVDLERLMRQHPLIRTSLEVHSGFYYLSGKRASVQKRQRAAALTRALLTDHAWVLELIRRTPYVRLLALSGATAHENASDDDIDVFVVTARERTWAVALWLFVLMKLLRRRRMMCLNYFISEDRLALAERDAFTANQIAGLKPLAGRAVYYRLVRANRWGERFFPNFWRHFRELEPRPADEPEAGSRRGEALLRIGVGWLLERLGRRLLGGYLRRQHRRAGSPAAVKLERDIIKLHFADHGAPLADHLETSLQNLVEAGGPAPGPAEPNETTETRDEASAR